MRSSTSAVAALAALALAAAGCGGGGEDRSVSKPTQRRAASAAHVKPTGRVYRVRMKGNRFVPHVLTIPAGSTVEWINDDEVEHTATQGAAHWSSGDIFPGQTYRHTFTDVGRVSYLCRDHYYMSGVIKIQ